MSTYMCGLCWDKFGEGEKHPTIFIDCGHLGCRKCIESLISLEAEKNNPNYSCPFCRMPFKPRTSIWPIYPTEDKSGAAIEDQLDQLRVQVDIANDKISSQEMQLTKKDDQVAELTAKMQQMEMELQVIKTKNEAKGNTKNGILVAYGEFGSRVHRGEFDDSKCLNCESDLHESIQCPFPPVMRNGDQTTFPKWVNNSTYVMLLQMPGGEAGPMIKFMKEVMNLPVTRINIQTWFSFMYFDSGCWNCANPFHETKDCANEAAPPNSAKQAAKMAYGYNHPDKQKERFDKYLEKYGKR